MNALPAEFTAQQQESKQTPARVSLVLDDVGAGLTISAACKRAGIHPTVWADWCSASSDLASAYAAARAVGCDVMADECIAIADGELPCALDYKGHVDAQRVVDMANGTNATGSSYITRLLAGAGLEIARDRMRIDTRLKLLAQWDRRYSPKTTTELTGKDGGPIQLEDKGDAIALSAQLRDMKRARLAAPAAQLEHDAGGEGGV